MADVQIIDLDPKLSVDGSELLEIQDPAGGPGTSFSTPLSNLIGPQGPQGAQGPAGSRRLSPSTHRRRRWLLRAFV